MAYECLLTETLDGVLTLTLNRPSVFNAFNTQMGRNLTDALRAAGRDDAVRVVVITGAGRAFCAGQDLKELGAALAGDQPLDIGDLLRRQYNGLILTMRRLEKPVIASVNGVAAGAGMSLALAADIRIASEEARFVEAFVNIGLAPDSGSLYFLPRFVGLAKALELCLLGEPISATVAAELGLVAQVTPASELTAATAKLASKLASGPGRALALTKRGLNRAPNASLDEMLENEALLQTVASRTEDFREGVLAFSEKRAPKFRGR